MIVKVFEVRDEGTLMPVIAIKVEPANESERYLAARMGYGVTPEAQAKFVLMSLLSGDQPLRYDPAQWNGCRTRTVAHQYIEKHFDELETGDVVDVQYILGETDKPKISEGREGFPYQWRAKDGK